MRVVLLSGRKFIYFVLPVFVLFLQACDPTIYKKPLTDFRDANQGMRDAYFLQLDIGSKAVTEDNIAAYKRKIWSKDTSGMTPSFILKYANKIRDERSKPLYQKEILVLREKAFEALDVYAATLLSLASDEDTNEIIGEIKGFSTDTKDTVSYANNFISSAGGKLPDLTKKMAKWIAPLSGVSEAFGLIAEIVSDVARERAIRETVVTADESIRKLISVLKNEAIFSENLAAMKYENIINKLTESIEKKQINNGQQEALEYLGNISALNFKLKASGDIAQIFDLALESQNQLKSKVAMSDYKDWVRHIEEFKSQVKATKLALSEIKDMY